jgi:hypothetical protein
MSPQSLTHCRHESSLLARTQGLSPRMKQSQGCPTKLKRCLDVKLQRILTDRGSEYCGSPERHE